MAVFDEPKAGGYPRQWKDMSVELKLMFVYHGGMMVLFFIGGTFSLGQELTLTVVLLAVLISISIRHRRSMNWRWQGVKLRNFVSAVAGVALIAVFLYAATPLFSPKDPRFFAMVPGRIWDWSF